LTQLADLLQKRGSLLALEQRDVADRGDALHQAVRVEALLVAELGVLRWSEDHALAEDRTRVEVAHPRGGDPVRPQELGELPLELVLGIARVEDDREASARPQHARDLRKGTRRLDAYLNCLPSLSASG